MQDIIETLDLYVNKRIPTGGFLEAVLSNNLSEACARADHINQQRLFQIVQYIYNNLPCDCWGSPEKVKSWLNPDREKIMINKVP